MKQRSKYFSKIASASLKLGIILICVKNVYGYEVIQVKKISPIFGPAKPVLRQEDEEEKVPSYFQSGKRDMDSGEEIKQLLEAKYKFKNDETTTRFRVQREDREDSRDEFNLESNYRPDVSESPEEQQLAWVFRSYAVRRIVGGMETSISMYPYNIAISRNAKHWCGGSVIDEQWIITAGHCLESAYSGEPKTLMPYIIRAGSSFHNRGGYQSRINKVFFPPHYTPGNADYDYSLARLDRPMPIGRNIAVLNLPSKEYVMKPDDILLVTGWGSTDTSGYGSIPDRLRFVPVPIMTAEDCQQAYRFYITPRMLCAGYATGGKDACNHDSGGPAVRDGVLIGIVSFGGKKCGDPQSPGVYSRVSEITAWVEKTITDNEASSVPELLPKIVKARQREKELQKFKAQVEDKKNRIKNWLRTTLSSPKFLELAKRKLREAGFRIRRSLDDENDNVYGLDDRDIDDINLSNQINERILGDGEVNEAEAFLRLMAVQQMVAEKNGNEEIFRNYNSSEQTDPLIIITP